MTHIQADENNTKKDYVFTFAIGLFARHSIESFDRLPIDRVSSDADISKTSSKSRLASRSSMATQIVNAPKMLMPNRTC